MKNKKITKRSYYYLFLISLFLNLKMNAQYAPEAFVTKWQVPLPFANTSYPIDYINLTTEGAYHYELFKLDGNTPILIEEGDNYGAISFTILEEDTGTYVLSMIPDTSHSEPFHRFMMDNAYPSTTYYTAHKLIELIQWGTAEWSTLEIGRAHV